LPGFEDVVARYHARAFLDIELKVPGLERTVVAALKELWPGRGFVVSSFLPEVVLAMYAEDASIPVGLIGETREELLRWTELPITYVIPHHRLIDSSMVQDMQRARKRILVWTVNSASEMENLRDWGVDGIISDDTSLLARTLGH
jgi:glycerophosphoryl diester phosphodiesterase